VWAASGYLNAEHWRSGTGHRFSFEARPRAESAVSYSVCQLNVARTPPLWSFSTVHITQYFCLSPKDCGPMCVKWPISGLLPTMTIRLINCVRVSSRHSVSAGFHCSELSSRLRGTKHPQLLRVRQYRLRVPADGRSSAFYPCISRRAENRRWCW
jgi:hypothetical protein